MQAGKGRVVELPSVSPVALCWPFERLWSGERQELGLTHRLEIQSEIAQFLSVLSWCLFSICGLSAIWTRIQMAPGAQPISLLPTSSLGLARLACWIEPHYGPQNLLFACRTLPQLVGWTIWSRGCLYCDMFADSVWFFICVSWRTNRSFNNFFLHENNQFQQPSPHEPPYHSKAECAREGGKKTSVRTQISV